MAVLQGFLGSKVMISMWMRPDRGEKWENSIKNSAAELLKPNVGGGHIFGMIPDSNGRNLTELQQPHSLFHSPTSSSRFSKESSYGSESDSLTGSWYSSRNGWDRHCLAVSLFSGSSSNIPSRRFTAGSIKTKKHHLVFVPFWQKSLLI